MSAALVELPTSTRPRFRLGQQVRLLAPLRVRSRCADEFTTVVVLRGKAEKFGAGAWWWVFEEPAQVTSSWGAQCWSEQDMEAASPEPAAQVVSLDVARRKRSIA